MNEITQILHPGTMTLTLLQYIRSARIISITFKMHVLVQEATCIAYADIPLFYFNPGQCSAPYGPPIRLL